MSSIDQVISRLKEKKVYVNKVSSRKELMKQLTESIQNGNSTEGVSVEALLCGSKFTKTNAR